MSKAFHYNTFFCVAICYLSFIYTPASGQKIYFPHTLYDDSVTMYRALPELAKKVVVMYTDSNKSTYFDNCLFLQVAAKDYETAGNTVDSLRKYDQNYPENKQLAFQTETYIYAMKAQIKDSAPFEEVYIKTFPTLYNKLSDHDKIWVELTGFDTASARSDFKELTKITGNLKNQKSDSIGLTDARLLLRNYVSYTINRVSVPLARPFLESTKFKASYPVIKSSKFSGVVPVVAIDETPDPAMQYNLLIELVSGIENKKDSLNIYSINEGLSEIGRLLNLHVLAGVPKKNIHIVAVVHGPAINSFLENSNYKLKYNTDNPNLTLLKELKDNGVKMIACGQAMFFFNVKKEQMIPGMKVALTAQTVLSTYQLKNYVHYKF